MHSHASERRSSGQALVEFALVFPLMCFAALGFTEAGFLMLDKGHQDRATYAVVSWAASHPEWQSIAARELPGCDVEVTESPPGLFTATATCTYQPKVTSNIWDGLPMTSQEVAVQTEPVPS